MFRFIILLIVSTFLISKCSAASYCPNAQDLYPCECIGTDFGLVKIVCGTSDQLNLTSIFLKVSQDERAVRETYESLEITNSKLVEIPENAFGKIKFSEIAILEGCSSLKRIHPNAFSYQSKTTFQLWIQAKNVIPDKSEPNFFYDLVNSFENLEILGYLSHIGTLEEKFRKNWNNLESLYLRVDAIQGNPFSNMSKIERLSLTGGNLNYVSKSAIKTGNLASKGFSLRLSNNKLNGSSFEKDVFTSTSLNKGKVFLFLDKNQITYLDEAVFKSFFASKNRNHLRIDNNPLDCSDCRSAWICKSNISEQVRQASEDKIVCVDGRDFTDCTKSFLKCK